MSVYICHSDDRHFSLDLFFMRNKFESISQNWNMDVHALDNHVLSLENGETTYGLIVYKKRSTIIVGDKDHSPLYAVLAEISFNVDEKKLQKPKNPQSLRIRPIIQTQKVFTTESNGTFYKEHIYVNIKKDIILNMNEYYIRVVTDASNFETIFKSKEKDNYVRSKWNFLGLKFPFM